jgi:hypothetical protein
MPWSWPTRHSLHDIQTGGDPLLLDVLGVKHAKDGQNVELVHVHFAQHTVAEPPQMTVLHHGKVPEPQDLKDKIETMRSEGPTSLKQIEALNKEIGNFTAKAIRQFARQQHFSVDEDIDLIGATGCFIEESTDDGIESDASPGDQESTELGDLSVIAAKTCKTTVGDFHNSAVASGLPEESLSSNFNNLIEGQADESGVIDSARGPLNVAFASFEGCVGRPLSATDEEDNERTGLVGHVQSGDNYFELRKKVVKFWGECPGNLVAPTQQLIVECEC